MKRLKSKYEILRQKIYIIIYGANTPGGKLFDLVLLLVILLSVAMVMIDSIKSVDEKYHNFLYYGEWVVTVFFTLEYILRLLCNKKPLSYVFSFYGIVDLISLLPMYLSYFFPEASFLIAFRAIRLLRLFAILDLMPIIGQQSHLKLALNASKHKIIVFMYFMIVMAIVLGTLMYIIEGGHSGFTDIPNSVYWCIVTMTTVGYGDIAPITYVGKTIASFIMIMGYGIIAVPTGIVTAEYTNLKYNNPELKTRIVCPECTSFIYDLDANFCSNCGAKLLNTEKLQTDE